jgi:hypothetical protein
VVYALGIGPIAHISIPLLTIRVSAIEPSPHPESQLSPVPPC